MTSLLGQNLVPTLVALMALLIVWYIVRDSGEGRDIARTFTISFVVGIVILYAVLGILYYPGA